MEKQRFNVPTSHRAPRSSHTRFHIGILLGLAFLSWILYSRVSREEVPGNRFDAIAINHGLPLPPKPKENFAWAKITPTRHLEYVPCFDQFECARLDVPMDHKSLSAVGSRVAVAVIRYPAPVPVTDPRYAGPILLNPGGPGGSGVNFARTWAKTISKIVNPPFHNSSDLSSYLETKYYDILSFDPRGVNNTTPHFNCFPDNLAYDAFQLQMQTEGLGSPDARSKMWARTQALGSGCSDQDSEIIHHMNTPTVVADMVQIIERHGEWRSQQAKLLINTPVWESSTASLPLDHPYSRKSILGRTQYHKGQEKLNYWGFSYGTVLGSTFAALESDRVGRVIIDGVCDTTDYYETTWLTNLRDTDKIMQKFYEYCANATFEKCPLNRKPLHTEEHMSDKDIELVIENLLLQIKEDPISVPGTSDRAPDIITYSDVIYLVTSAVYDPVKLFPELALLLADIAYSNGSKFAAHKTESRVPSCPLHCNKEETQQCSIPTSEAFMAILCSDGLPLDNWDKTTWFERMDILMGQSKWLGEYWSTITMHCAAWKGRARWSIKAEDIKGNTSWPMLLIGNSLDPVTPLYNAHVMKTHFPGSEVLTQDSEGHCSIASPSLCTAKAIRNYFQSGALPEPGTVCEPEEIPLIGKIDRDIRVLSKEDRALLEIVDEMRGLDLGALGPLGTF